MSGSPERPVGSDLQAAVEIAMAEALKPPRLVEEVAADLVDAGIPEDVVDSLLSMQFRHGGKKMSDESKSPDLKRPKLPPPLIMGPPKFQDRLADDAKLPVKTRIAGCGIADCANPARHTDHIGIRVMGRDVEVEIELCDEHHALIVTDGRGLSLSPAR